MKSVRLMFDDDLGHHFDRTGEFVVTAGGIEGSLVYAASALIREQIRRQGSATIRLDLVPGRDAARLAEGLAHGRGSRSLPNHLREHAGLDGVKAALLRERYSAAELTQQVSGSPQALAQELKAWPVTLTAARPIAEAISTAGGVRLEALDEHLMLQALPGVFCAGEMLDWEAPTGGYLLSASLASGRVAGQGVLAWWHRATTPGGRMTGMNDMPPGGPP
jgi:predicted flavoprotein YhiN